MAIGTSSFLTHSLSPPVLYLRSTLFLSSMRNIACLPFFSFPPREGQSGSRWPILSAQDPFLLNQGSTLDDAHPALGTIVFIHVCFPFPAVFLWLRLFARLSRRSKRTRSHSIYHSTKSQPQLPVTTHRLTISGPRSPFSLRFENVSKSIGSQNT